MNDELNNDMIINWYWDSDSLDVVLGESGLIPASSELKLVRCPFETSIATSERDVPLCKHAEDCNLEDALDLCPVPHHHNFESPGLRLQFEHRTTSVGFTMELALQRVQAKTKTVRDMKAAGKKIIKPKEVRRVSNSSAIPHKEKTSTRAEAYSVYEHNTTPPAIPKTEIIETRSDKWDKQDRKESKRLQFIQDCRDLKLQAMLASC